MAVVSPEAAARELLENGYVIIRDRVPRERLEKIRAEVREIVASSPVGTNSFLGYRTRRSYSILAKTRSLDELVLDPLVLATVERVLADFQLGVSVGIELQSGEVAQSLHTDQSLYPLPAGTGPVLVNTMWALDPFTTENGATRLVPGSHRPDFEGGAGPSGAGEVAAEMSPGSVLIYLGNLVHRAGANQTDGARLGVVLEYVVGWLRPQENLGLCYPPAVVRDLPSRLQEILGYDLYPPFLGYVDGLHPKEWLSRQLAADPAPAAGEQDDGSSSQPRERTSE